MMSLSSMPPTFIVLYSSTPQPEGGWARQREEKKVIFFIHLTDVVLKYCRARRAVGGGRSRRRDRLELMVLMWSLNMAICSKVVRTGTAFIGAF